MHRLRHLHAHGPGAEHQHPARNLLQPGHLAIGPHPVELAEAVDWRYHRVPAGGQHHVVGGVLLAVHLHPSRAHQAAAAAQDLDAHRLPPIRPVPESS